MNAPRPLLRALLALAWFAAASGMPNCYVAQVDVTPPADESGQGGAGTVGGAQTSKVPPVSGELTQLGAPCREDGDCGAAALHCLAPNANIAAGLGAPGSGLCTLECEVDRDCGSGAICASLAEAPLVSDRTPAKAQRFCVQGCSLGPSSGAAKCQGRPDLACRPFEPAHATTCAAATDVCPDGTSCFHQVCRESGCGPRCNADVDCASGRHCNSLTGLCDARAVAPVHVGATCQIEGNDPACGGGTCVKVEDSNGMLLGFTCTESCTLGRLCAAGAGACAWPRFGDFTAGDVGYCEQRCDCNDDCTNPGARCVPFGSAEAEQAFGSRGACHFADPDAATLDCAAGGAAGG